MSDDDDLFAALQKIPPRDVVGRTGPAPEVVAAFKNAVGEQIEVHLPGEEIERPDGYLAMTEPRTVTATLLPYHDDIEENTNDRPAE